MLSGMPLLLLVLAAIAFIVVSIARYKLSPFLAMLLAALGTGLVAGLPTAKVVAALQTGFGILMGQIGMMVVLGTILGVLLERSGAALRVADTVLHIFGRKRPVAAITTIGALVGVPVFCDSGFLLLSKLNPGIARHSGANPITLSVALASGLFATHTLVPPTPGPIAAAGNLQLQDHLGLVMLLGLVVSLPTVWVGYRLARLTTRHMQAVVLPDSSATAPTEAVQQLPGMLVSSLPVVVPVLLIALAGLAPLLALAPAITAMLQVLGLPLIALLIGLVLVALLFGRAQRSALQDGIEHGLKLAGPILLITGAGGAFGAVLKETPVHTLVEGVMATLGGGQTAFLLLGFVVAALFKTAQGSTTAAMAISSSLLGALAAGNGFHSPTDLALLVMAIGAGAMTVSHVNDSYFWMIAQLGGVPTPQLLRSHTLCTLGMGSTALVVVLLLHLLLR